jgi:hypothetical protein
MQRRWLALIGGAAVLIAGLLAIELSQPTVPPRYAKHYDEGYASRNAEDGKGESSESLWQLITDDAVAFVTLCLTAVTGMLAVSTLGLWIVTGRGIVRQSRDMEIQAGLTREAIELSRGQFIATFRPRIRIHSVQLERIDNVALNRYFWRVKFDYINIGETAALIATINAAIVFFSYETAQTYVKPVMHRCTIGKGVLNGGEFDQIDAIPQALSPHYVSDNVERRDSFLHVFGEIKYIDQRGTERVTAFHRVYNPSTKIFNVAANSHHEYAY